MAVLRYAQTEAGFVTGVYLFEEGAAPEGMRQCPDWVGPGCGDDGEEFHPMPETPAPPPDEVTMRQARLALLGAGLLDDVEAAIAAMPDGPGRRAAEITWEFSQTVRRDNAVLIALSASLGLTSGELDALFVQASLIP